MLRRCLLICALLGSVSLIPSALAQGRGLPNPELVANADNYQPPKLDELAAKLAQQPDMTGLWSAMQPVEAGVGPVFDPVRTFWPPQPVPGEARFGPVPGTYIKDIPYTAEYQKKYRELIEETKQGKSRDTFAACEPYGVPRMIGDSPVPFDIIQAPEVMFWYNDYGRTERRIFLDGRPHPTGPIPTGESGRTYSGHSVGRWEGNTLVVETVGMFGSYFDETPAPFSDQIGMVERMRLIDANILEIQMTFTDPVALEKPWVVTRYFRRGGAAAGNQGIRRAYLDLNDRPCIPNVRIDENGFQVALLPQELEAQNAAKSKKQKPSRSQWSVTKRKESQR
jgi:hypothetical protein